MKDLKCIVCKKIFYGATNRLYCSVECSRKRQKELYDKNKKVYFKKEVKCPICNKLFIRKHRCKIYCSKDCSDQIYIRKKKELNMGIFNTKRKDKYQFLRIRFEIFKRDNFVCQYCGRNVKDDKIKLNVDHIHPRKLGGKNNKENLITSCEDCNLGKADVLLTDRRLSKQR